MRIAQWEQGIEIWTPAKLNLFLEVLSRRTDGYHGVESLMVPINLYDTVRLRRSPTSENSLLCRVVDGLVFGASDAGARGISVELPQTCDNLVYRAMQRMQEITGRAFPVAVTLVKRIPTQAGLGGASSDAAATLVGLSRLQGLPHDPETLADTAAQLGSDVPFFLHGGPAWCSGRGEGVSPVRGLPPMHLVIVKPTAGLSTAAVYRQLQLPDTPRSGAELLDALRSGRLALAGRLLRNRLQGAAQQLCPQVAKLHRVFSGLDLLGHQLTGSGTGYFGLCRSRQHALRVAAQLRAARLGRVFVAQSLSYCPP